MQLAARKILDASPVDVLENFVGKFKLQFDDGEVIDTTGTQVAISRYGWEIIKKFPNVPITKEHFISSYMKDELSFTPTSFRLFLSKIVNSVFDIYPMDTNEKAWALQSEVWEEYMRAFNDIFNDVQIHRAKYHMSMNIEDILDIEFDPEIIKIKKDYPVNANTVKDPHYIASIYKRKQKVMTSERHKFNNISIMMRSSVIKIPQLMQCFGPRGSVTDINSDIFNEPIQDGYMDGFHRLYDRLIESRTAAMSLNNQSSPLKFTEYFSRRVQFIGMELRNLHFGDCGSEYYFEFQVRDNRDGYVISDLEFLEGMYYVADEVEVNGKLKPILKPIKKTDHHLIGKRIKVRTIFGCQHSDPQGVCSTCFGQASRSVPKYRNVGHFAIISFTQIITQLVLSTKHHTSSAIGALIELTDHVQKFMKIMKDGLATGLKDDIKKNFTSIKLVISEEAIDGISDISNVRDVGVLSARRTSHINRIKLLFTAKDGSVTEEIIDVVPITDVGYLSMETLKYMKDNGWTITDDGMVEIEMIDFDTNRPIVEITPKQSDMYKYAKGLEKMIKSSVKEIKQRAISVTPEMFLMELSDAVNSKLGINLSILQVLAYTMLGTDIVNKDFSLPKPHTGHGVGTMDQLIWGRSLSGALSYEKQGRTLASPNSYIHTNRSDCPMDEFFVPEQMDLEYFNLLEQPEYTYSDLINKR